MSVQAFSKSFSQPVRQSLQENVRIVILVRLERFRVRLDPVDADCKSAYPVARRIDKVGKAHIRAVAAFLDLLAQEGEDDFFLAVYAVDRHIIPVAPRPSRTWPEACYTARG